MVSESSILDLHTMCHATSFIVTGIQKYGAGNWKEILGWMESGKKERQFDDHYWQLIMGRHGFCLPAEYSIDDFISKHQTEDLFPGLPPLDSNGEEGIPDQDHLHVPVVPGYSRGDIVRRDAGVHYGGRGGARPPGHAPHDKGQQILELPGYMPLREDFDTEYENDAEEQLKDMEFHADDHPSEVQMKLEVIRIYNRKLREREKRKQFVLERGLTEIKKLQANEKKLTKEERDIIAKLRPFARYHAPEEHEALVEGMLKAHRLRIQIEMYKVYQQMGLKTLDDVRQYEKVKKEKEHELRIKKERQSSAYLYESKTTGLASSLGKRGAASTSSIQSRNGGDDTEETSTVASKSSRRRGAAPAPAASSNNGKLPPGESDPQSTAMDTSDGSEALTTAQSGAVSSHHQQLPAWDKAASAVTLDLISNAPGGHLLSALEVDFCARLPMYPKKYLSIKQSLAQEFAANQSLTRQDVHRKGTENAKQNDLLFDFFVREASVLRGHVSSS